jgi:ABC-type amino acid transport substrate-binding protein
MHKVLFTLIVSILPFLAAANDTLIVGYSDAPPFITLDNEQVTGPSIWLADHVAEDLGKTIVYRQMGFKELLTALENGTVHLSASPLTITSDRIQRMDFSAPYYVAHSTIVTPERSTWSIAVGFVQSFFSLNFFRALGALAFIILIFGLLVWIFERRGNPEEFGNGIKGLWSGFWWSAVTMTTVGYGDKSPRTTGGRVVALVWMFTAIVVISGFTASIASSLTMNQMSGTADELNAFKDRKLGVLKNSSTSRWLSDHFFPNQVAYADLDAALSDLRSGKIAGVADDRPVLFYLLQESTDDEDALTLESFNFNAQHYAFGLRKGMSDSFRDSLNLALLRRIESPEWQVVLNEFGLGE